MIHVHYENDLKRSGKQWVHLIPLRRHLHTGSASLLLPKHEALLIKLGLNRKNRITPQTWPAYSPIGAYCKQHVEEVLGVGQVIAGVYQWLTCNAITLQLCM